MPTCYLFIPCSTFYRSTLPSWKKMKCQRGRSIICAWRQFMYKYMFIKLTYFPLSQPLMIYYDIYMNFKQSFQQNHFHPIIFLLTYFGADEDFQSSNTHNFLSAFPGGGQGEPSQCLTAKYSVQRKVLRHCIPYN